MHATYASIHGGMFCYGLHQNLHTCIIRIQNVIEVQYRKVSKQACIVLSEK